MDWNFGRDLAYLGGAAGVTATGTTVTTSPIFDMTKYNGIVAIQTGVGVTATGNYLNARAGTATGTMTDLAGTNTTAHTSLLILEVVRPHNVRYVDFIFHQPTSGQCGPLLVFGTGSRARPTTNSTLLTYKFVNSPATGTATSS